MCRYEDICGIGTVFGSSLHLCGWSVPSLPGFSVTAPWAFIWFLDGNENKVDISIVGTNGKCFLINAHGVFRRMGTVTKIPGSIDACALYPNFVL